MQTPDFSSAEIRRAYTESVSSDVLARPRRFLGVSDSTADPTNLVAVDGKSMRPRVRPGPARGSLPTRAIAVGM